MACDLGDVDRIVTEYLKSQLHINKADTGSRLSGVRDHPTMKEVDMAFKAYVPYLHPDKHHFTSWLASTHPDLSVEDTQVCKQLLLEFYNTWSKTKDDLKTLDRGLVTQVRGTKLDACGLIKLSLKHTHVLCCLSCFALCTL
jgi:hypothetical protein